jgi:hypothetical protein
VVVASVEVPVTVKRPVVVAFTKFDEVAKRLDEVVVAKVEVPSTVNSPVEVEPVKGSDKNVEFSVQLAPFQ